VIYLFVQLFPSLNHHWKIWVFSLSWVFLGEINHGNEHRALVIITWSPSFYHVH